MVNPVNPAFRSVTHSRLPYVSFRGKPYGFSLTLHYKMNPVTFRYDTPAVSRFLRLLSMEHTNIVLSFAIFVSYSGFVLIINAIVHACEMLSSYILLQNKTKPIYTPISYGIRSQSKKLSILKPSLMLYANSW